MGGRGTEGSTAERHHQSSPQSLGRTTGSSKPLLRRSPIWQRRTEKPSMDLHGRRPEAVREVQGISNH